MTEPRFLLVRLGSLGDIVHTFPAVAALRETFPRAEIVWLTHPRWTFLVTSSGLASAIWSVENRSLASLQNTIRRVRASHWNAAIDYQGLWKSAAIPLLGGIQRRIGFSSATIREFGVPVLYTDRVTPGTRHIADQNGELSWRAGARAIAANVTLQVSPEDIAAVAAQLCDAGIGDSSIGGAAAAQYRQNQKYIVLSPGGGWRSKCWPAERFGALCQRVHNSLGLRCVVNFGPGEDDLAAAVLAASRDAAPMLYNGDLGKLMALLRNATCIVGGDTGPLHLAIALGTPAVALHGPTDPLRNGPYRASQSGDIFLRAPGARRNHARGNRPDPSMLALTVDAVYSALCRRIGAVE